MRILFLCAIFIVINVFLVVSYFYNKKYKEKELNKLKQEQEQKKLEENDPGKNTKSDKDLREEIEPLTWCTWVSSIAICLDIWLIGAVFTHLWATSFFDEIQEGDSRKALFGDSFGAVNALVSAFAFAGMIVSFFMQRTELRLQRKELQENRDEMSQQTAQFTAENRNLEIQRFENLFYNMLNLQQRIVDGLKYEQYQNVPQYDSGICVMTHKVLLSVAGRDVFRHLFNDAVFYHKNEFGNRCEEKGFAKYLSIYGIKRYDDISYPSYFDHYFRHLYKIIQFVDSKVRLTDNSNEQGRFLSYEEAYEYISFVRGTLSRYELVWLYYNALVPDYHNFKVLIEKYSLLKSLRSDYLTTSKEADSFFAEKGLVDDDFDGTDFLRNDYEFYMKTENNDKGNNKYKYHISAFWNKGQIEEGRMRLKKWESFIQDHTNKKPEESSIISRGKSCEAKER